MSTAPAFQCDGPPAADALFGVLKQSGIPCRDWSFFCQIQCILYHRYLVFVDLLIEALAADAQVRGGADQILMGLYGFDYHVFFVGFHVLF